jgi:hypothetical protein
LGADGDFEYGISATLAGAVVAGAVPAAARLYYPAVGIRFEGREIFGGAQDHRAAIAAAAAVRPAARPVLLAVKGDAAVAAAPRADDEARFIYELQRG